MTLVIMLYRLAQIYMLAWPYGYPFLYSGYSFSNNEQGPPLNLDFSTTPILDSNLQCQAPWTCEHRLPEIPPMVDFRNQTNGAFYVSQLWSNGYDALAFSRGAAAFVALNFQITLFSKTFRQAWKMDFIVISLIPQVTH